MSKPLPPCMNRTCPSYMKNEMMAVIKYDETTVTFFCKRCQGIHIRTIDWRRATQENKYRTYGRPEYARTKAYFFQGRNTISRSH
jgi:hypothetical protein